MPVHSPEALPDFQRRQYEFAAHIRDPGRHARPGDVEDRRMAVYRELFYNNVEGFLSGGFPVLRSLYEEAAWHGLVREFFSTHHCKTPYFLEISREFLEFLQARGSGRPGDPPFLLELAHYEWVEVALSVSEDEPDWETIDPDGDLLAGRPVLSPLAWCLSYHYPVHRISRDTLPEGPGQQPTHLLVYRDGQDAIGFMELNPATAHLLTRIQEHPAQSGLALLEGMATGLPQFAPEAVVQGGAQTLLQLKAAKVILGTSREVDRP